MTQTTTRAHYKPLLCSKVGQYPRRGLDCTLTLEDVKSQWATQEGRCWYSGVEMTTDVGFPTKVTLDRLDSSKGYTAENVVLCTITTNLMKKDMSVEIFRDWIRRIHTTFAQKESL